jgi:putative nucleotidyltransferase with HDIG domain
MAETITLHDIVDKTSDLPTLPAAALRVMRETEASTSNAASIARILAHDQSLSARVLRLSNSAYYGLSRRITSLQESVVVLGMRCVRNLCLVASTYPWMSKPLKGYGLGPRELWTHSYGTALGAQMVAKRCGRVNDETAFTAGLLHDIGKTALSVWIDDKAALVAEYAARADITFDAAERKILGYDHTEVGEFLGARWNLPEEMVVAIRGHHDPERAETASHLTDCVHLGNYLTMALGYGLGADGMHYLLSEASLERLGMSDATLEELAGPFVAEFEEHQALFDDLAA